MKKQIFLTLIILLGLVIFFIDLAYIQFLIIGNRSMFNKTIEDILAFYGYIHLTIVTMTWYFVSVLIIYFAMQYIKKLPRGWIKWMTTTGLIALMLAPGIFVDKSQAQDVATLLSAVNYKIPSLIVPAWVSIIRYLIEGPYLWYSLIAILITFWTIPLTWLILLGLSIRMTKVE